MHTLNRIVIKADSDTVYQAASETADWPRILPHYRYVHTLYSADEVRVLEMSATRDFGFFQYPTWWSSIQRNAPHEGRVRYRHVGGVTRGMDVEWQIRPLSDETVEVVILHHLSKNNPVVALFYKLVVGQIFVRFIAQRTLEGVKRHCER